tara:strand:- start:18167 stop:18487 length:321 start_codon:yes stop_codon:yes gene_type:complete
MSDYDHRAEWDQECLDYAENRKILAQEMKIEQQFKEYHAIPVTAVSDPNVNAIMNKFAERSNVGLDKYGVDTTRTDIDLQGWLTHLQEELMDATIYVERIKKELGS